MGADVILNHLRHQARDATANARDHMHDALHSPLRLAPARSLRPGRESDATRASSFFFSLIVCTIRFHIGYPPMLSQSRLMPMIAKTASPDKARMQPPRPVDPPRKETRIGLAFVEQFAR